MTERNLNYTYMTNLWGNINYKQINNFDEWYMYDLEKGYNSCSYLARIAEISDEMSEEEVLLETERAIDEILKYDFMKVRKKIYSDEEK